MADQKLTDLTELTAPVAADLLYIIDDPAGTPTSKKATVANVVGDQGWGAITIIDGTGSQTLANQTWTKLTQWEQAGGALLNTSVPSSLNGVQVDAAGFWLAQYSVSFDTDQATTETFKFRLYWNATAQDDSLQQIDADTALGTFNVSGQCIIDVTSTGALVELYAYANDGGGDVDIKQGSITVTKLGLT